MTRKELDTLWFKAMREAGDDFTRYRFAALVAEAEREACARVAESMRPNGGRAWDDAQRACFSALTDLAEAIRARGSK